MTKSPSGVMMWTPTWHDSTQMLGPDWVWPEPQGGHKVKVRVSGVLVSWGYGCSLASGHITAISASMVILPSPVPLPPLSYMNTCDT